MSDITLIVPYYNNESHIEACIESIKNQIYTNFEVIFINDGSTDTTEQIINEMMKGQQITFQHIINETNKGVAARRNDGLLLAKTEWVYFFDADDMLSPFALNTMRQLAQHDIEGVIAPISKFTLKKRLTLNELELDYEYQSNETNPSAFLRKNTACGILYKMNIIKEHELKFNENLRVFSDWSFVIEYQKYVSHFIRIKTPGFYYRGEVYDPFDKPNLSGIEFKIMFESYLDAYQDNRRRTIDYRVRKFLDRKLIERIKRYFNPDSPYINERYNNHAEQLSEVLAQISPESFKNLGVLMKKELNYLKKGKFKKAKKINIIRKQSRVVRRLVLNPKARNRTLYQMFGERKAIDQKTIVFESFAGKGYSDNPKYIYEEMYKKYPDYKYIWVLNNPNKFEIPGPAVKVKRLSKEYYNAYATAKFWVANARTPLSLIKKPGQVYIQTWHGTPLKRLGNDMKVVRMPGTTTAAYKYNFRKETNRWDYMLSPNRYSSHIFKSAFWMDDDRILETGYPRNDILTTRKDDHDFINGIKEKLGISPDKKIILYAPTWRDDEYIKKGKYKFNLKIDLENLRDRLGEDTVILLRMHYLIASALNIKEYKGFAIDVSNYPDISELYLISDLLITDYSSVFFDFGVLKRPQVFFSYDLDKYKDNLRGFYLDYYNDLPGPIYEEPYSMAIALKDIDTLAIKYQNKIDAFYDKFCDLEDGTAAIRVIDKMIEKSHI